LRQRKTSAKTNNGQASISTQVPSSAATGMSSPSKFHSERVWASIAITIGWNGVGLAISLMTGSHLHLDLIGTTAFTMGLLPGVYTRDGNRRILFSTLSIILWSMRLAGFLFYRALIVRHEGRLETTLATASGTTFFWLISAFWGVFAALPHSLGLGNDEHEGIQFTNKLGIGLALAGWCMETVADTQKWLFKQDHPGEFCNVGLWQYSQFPNYLGELVFWMGILIMNLPALAPKRGESMLSWYRVVLAFWSPAFLWLLLNGQASGSITNSKQMAYDKYGYGSNEEYTQYIDKTPLIIPFTR